MSNQNLITEYPKIFKKFLENNYNSARAQKEKAYLYSDLKHYGIGSTPIRNFCSKYKKDLRELDKTSALKLAKNLWSQPSFEEKANALGILDLHKELLDITDMHMIEKMMKECKGWALLDSLIIPLFPYICKKDKKAFAYLKRWIKDSDFWVRRSALLAQLLLFRLGDKLGDKKLFFEFAVSQFDESWIDKIYKDKLQNSRAKFFIRKAIGWTLREMCAKDPKSVFDFVRKYKGKMSGLSFREATRKLPESMQKQI